ncbi:AI-2E family transporter [Mucilaginibacter auburnensis]|uniref:Putative PurR-regulated permease PerM n=1 Tax=Mucilaginibacter auburnensis TaxID=1457233 RepID=A0A2H9VUT3_9SPHI|nr:AI-2E family transporter [Mucilaginibacter auburnensis]PJJ84577.1 putative PurR-regulated permease PerM [Mucilaginibacter auburnensis]
MISKRTIAPFYERLALVLIGLVVLGYLIIQGKELLDPLLFGFLFAILLLPLSNFLERVFKMPRSMSSFLSVILLVGVIALILYMVGRQISFLTADWPMLKNQLSQSVNDVSHWIESRYNINLESQKTMVDDTAKKLLNSGTEVLGTTFGAVSSLMLFYIFIMIFTFFILFYRRLLHQFVLKAFGGEHDHVVNDITENVQTILRQYILGLLFEMIIVAAMACAAFWMIGIKYAVLLGLLVGIFNIIPYLGIFTALVLSVLITFATGPISNVIAVAVSIIVIHAIDANLLLPTVVGSKVRLNALITFLGIILGEMLWGLSGMFLSIPVTAIFKIIFDRIESTKPWGYLLGGDYEVKPAAKRRMKTQ